MLSQQHRVVDHLLMCPGCYDGLPASTFASLQNGILKALEYSTIRSHHSSLCFLFFSSKRPNPYSVPSGPCDLPISLTFQTQLPLLSCSLTPQPPGPLDIPAKCQWSFNGSSLCQDALCPSRVCSRPHRWILAELSWSKLQSKPIPASSPELSLILWSTIFYTTQDLIYYAIYILIHKGRHFCLFFFINWFISSA